jgi:hypothetical protein
MIEKGLYSFCVSACIFMLILSLSINFVNIVNVFGSNASSSSINHTIANATETAVNGFDIIAFITNPLFLLSSALLIPIIMLAGRIGNFNIVGVYLFSVIFWGSWLSTSSVFSYGGTEAGNWFSNPVMGSIYILVSAVMVFIFSGAAIGMLMGTE